MTIHLCFHGIGTCVDEREPGEGRYWLQESRFIKVLDRVAGAPGVELSFDDGNRSDVEIALPALRDRGLRATFFPLAGRLDDPRSLSAADLQELRAHGMSIGNHGWQHVPWRGLSVADARREMVDSRVALAEASGARITEAALPLGRYDRATLGHLWVAGYDAVYSSDRYPSRGKSWLKARYSLTAEDTAESVSRILRTRPGGRELRNFMASGVKRAR
jgi:peptidoglycan/xylan/chitin deacetylase (PgdA/CDA1 family)